MSEEISHNCGLCVAHTLHDAYSFIGSLQHRGREAVGIAAIGDTIDVIKWKGTVSMFDITDLHKIFPSDKNYHTYMAHVRYATRGRKDEILIDAHPHTLGGYSERKNDHMFISDCDMVAVHNGQVNSEYLQEIDASILNTGCDTEALLHLISKKGEQDILKEIPGAFTLAFADKGREGIIVLRDKLGMRPGVLGWKDGKYCIASEDIALRKNGGEYVEELDPGCAYYLFPNGSYRKEEIEQVKPKHCFFEWNYLSDLDSILNGINVRRIRESLGEVLAEEFNPEDADYVTFLPRCPEVAARSYSRHTRIPLKHIFYKMRKERSFQGSTSQDRKNSIKGNLNLLPEIDEISTREFLEDKTVIIIDDSTIRGTNSPRARELLYEKAKVKKAYLVNYTPQIGIIGSDKIPRGCTFGVDMSPDDNFIARGRTLEEISEEIGMPIRYISQEGMFKAFEKSGISSNNLCTYCIGGKHPFE